MSTTTPIPDEQPQDGAPRFFPLEKLAEYARACRAVATLNRAQAAVFNSDAPCEVVESARAASARAFSVRADMRRGLVAKYRLDPDVLLADVAISAVREKISVRPWSPGDLLADPASNSAVAASDARSGQLTQDDLEDTNGRWRACTTTEDREAGQRVWQAYRVGEEAHTEVTRLSTGWFIESPGRAFSLDDARELVQLMEKVERQDRHRAAVLSVPPPPAGVAKAIDEYGIVLENAKRSVRDLEDAAAAEAEDEDDVDPRVRTEKDDTVVPAFDPDHVPAEVVLLVEIRDLLKELVAASRVERASSGVTSMISSALGRGRSERPQQSVENHSFENFLDFHEQVARGAHSVELPLLGSELAQIRDRVFGPGSAHHEETLTALDAFRVRLVLAMLALHHLERVRENGRVFVLGPNAPAARSVVKFAAEIVSASPSLGGWAYQEFGLGRLKGLGRGSIVAVNAGTRRVGASSVEGEIPTLILAPWLRTEEHETALRVLQSKAAKTSSRWVVPTVRVEAKED